MNASKTADMKRIAACADASIALSSDLKPAAIDEKLRDISSFVKALLRKKRCELTILVLSDPLQ